MRHRIIVMFFLAMAFGLGFSWLFGNAATGRTAVFQRELPAGAEPVALTTNDGIKLAGSFWQGSSADAPAVLLLHGLGSSRSQFDAEAAELAKNGFAVLAINLRAHGDSGGDTRSFGLFEARDAHAAFDWLKQRQRGAKVGVLGSSLGGAAALLGPDGPLKADAMVLNAVYPDIRRAIRNRIASMIGKPLSYFGEPLLSYQAPLRFGVWPDSLAPASAVRSFKGPILVVGGERDVFTPPAETREIFKAAAGPKELWIVAGADHNQTTNGDAYLTRLITFFRETLVKVGTS